MGQHFKNGTHGGPDLPKLGGLNPADLNTLFMCSGRRSGPSFHVLEIGV